MAEDEQPGIDVPSTDADENAQGEAEVEAHEFSVEEFQAESGLLEVVCGAYYSSN
jgi:hypothetical protein